MALYSGDLQENVIEKGDLSGRSRSMLRRFMSMSAGEKKAAFKKLPKWKKALLIASAPALFPGLMRPSPARIAAAMAIARRKAIRVHGSDDPELMGGLLKNWVKKFKAQSPAQRKADFKKLPWWKKALMIAAAPAILATAAASLPILLPTAAAVATAAASAKLTKKATIALAKKVKAVRAARLASKGDRTVATVAAIEQTTSATPAAAIPSVAQAREEISSGLPFPLSAFA